MLNYLLKCLKMYFIDEANGRQVLLDSMKTFLANLTDIF